MPAHELSAARMVPALLALLTLVAPTAWGALPAVANSQMSTVSAESGLTGDPVTPADNAFDAPQLRSGRYLVPAPAEGAASYLEIPRTVPGSTIWVSVSYRLGPETLTIEGDGELFMDGYADGDTKYECWNSVLDDQGAHADKAGTFHTSIRSTDFKGPCREASSILLKITRYVGGKDFEVYGDHFQLLVWEEPPVVNQAELPAAVPNLTWRALAPAVEPVPVTLGASFADAPAVANGTYSVHLDPGQTGLLRFRLDRGQHAQMVLSTDDTTDAYDPLNMTFASPMGGMVWDPGLPGTTPGDTELDTDGDDDVAAISTPTVAWSNRSLREADDDHQLGEPGWYYLMLFLETEKVPASGLDLVVQTGIFTDALAAEPQYGDVEVPPMPVVADFGDAGSAAGSTAADGEVPWVLAGSLFGGAALFAVLGVLMLARSRGRRA